MTKFAIVGMGFIADKHMDAISAIPGAELIAICDTNAERLKTVPSEIETFLDMEEMLIKLPEIDVVNICVPSGLHARLTALAVKYKKHVITEKPMALLSSDAEEMIKMTEEAGVKMAIVHPNRFRPAIMLLREVMEAGKLGKISHSNITVRWNRNQAYYDQAPWRGTKEFDGGVLMNQAIHSIDLLLWLMGDVKSVFGKVTTRLRQIESEDLAMGIVEFKDGSLGNIEAATTIYPENLEESIAIFGEKGSIKISGKNAIFIEHWNVEGYSEEEVIKLKEMIQQDPWGVKGHHAIIQDMIEAINENREPTVNGLSGLLPVKLIERIIESSEKGQSLPF